MKKSSQTTAPELTAEQMEMTFERLNSMAVATLRHLLQNGSEATRLRASVWLLNRMERNNPPINGEKRFEIGELRFGFDDEV